MRPNFRRKNDILDDEPGLLMKLNVEEDPRLFGQLRGEWHNKEEPKMNAIAFWCDPSFVKKFDREKVEFSSGDLVREFV